MSSKVYFTDMRVGPSSSLLSKFRRLIDRAGIADIDFADKFVAVKVHFGEFGNMAFLRQHPRKQRERTLLFWLCCPVLTVTTSAM